MLGVMSMLLWRCANTIPLDLLYKSVDSTVQNGHLKNVRQRSTASTHTDTHKLNDAHCSVSNRPGRIIWNLWLVSAIWHSTISFDHSHKVLQCGVKKKNRQQHIWCNIERYESAILTLFLCKWTSNWIGEPRHTETETEQ